MANSNVDLSKLELLRIHELRDVARSFGVKSPTSLTRTELIKQINLIVTGEQEPYYNVHKKGRPAKNEDVSIKELFTPTKEQLYENYQHKEWNAENMEGVFTLHSSNPHEMVDQPHNRAVAGYVDIHPEGYGLLRRCGFIPSPHDTYIPQQFVKQYKLVSGMRIQGVERHIAEGKPNVLISLMTAEIPHDDYDSMRGLNLGASIGSYLNLDIRRGGRYFIVNDKANDIFLNAYDVAQSIVKNNDEVLTKIVFTRSLPERLPQDIKNVEVLDVPFNRTDNDLVNAVNLFIAKAKIEALTRPVVIVLTNLTEIAKAYNNVLVGEISDRISNLTASKINNILACSKNLSNRAGITLVVLDNMRVEDNMKHMLDNYVMDNFNN